MLAVGWNILSPESNMHMI